MSSNQQRKTRLGDLLVERGYITEEQLLQAIEEQKTSHLQLGEILVNKGWVSTRQIRKILRVQSKLRNAILTSLLSFSPMVLVGCGGAAEKVAADEVVASSQAAKNDKGDRALKAKGHSKFESSSTTTTDTTTTDTSTSSPSDSSTSTSDTSSTETQPVTDTTEPVATSDTSSTETTTDSASSTDTTTAESTDTASTQTTESTEEAVTADHGATIHLSWDYPTERLNGSELEVYEIDSFRIYQLDENGGVGSVYVVDGLDTQYDIAGLADGEYHFAVTVVDNDGLESDYSKVVTVSVL